MDYKLLSKRRPFTLQKGVFYMSKGHLLPCKRAPFGMQKSIYCSAFVKLFNIRWVVIVFSFIIL